MSDTKRGISVTRDESGTMFQVKDSAEYEGALKVGGRTFDVKTDVRDSKDGLTRYFGLTGTCREDAAVTLQGALFPKVARTNDSGNATPSFTGDFRQSDNREKWAVAAWDMRGTKPPHVPYLSLKITVPVAKSPA